MTKYIENKYRVHFTVTLDGEYYINAVDEEVAKDIAKNGVKFQVMSPEITDSKVARVWISNIFKPKIDKIVNEDEED